MLITAKIDEKIRIIKKIIMLQKKVYVQKDKKYNLYVVNFIIINRKRIRTKIFKNSIQIKYKIKTIKIRCLFKNIFLLS